MNTINSILNRTQNHPDYQNAPYWGTPARSSDKESIVLIINISQAISHLHQRIVKEVCEGEYCSELKRSVLLSICKALFAYVNQDADTNLGTYNDNFHSAIEKLLDYSVGMQTAAHIVQTTETMITAALVRVVSDIDNLSKYKVIDHKLIDEDGLCLNLEINHD
jgi:hypothetical protein